MPVSVDRGLRVPLSAQLAGRLRLAMRDGTLKPGERLPSTRALSVQLGVSRTVVTEAYQQLYAEGWLEGRHGSGTYVADLALPAPPASCGGTGYGTAAPGGAEPPRPGDAGAGVPATSRGRIRSGGETVDLRPGQPWVRDYDEAAWRRAWRRAAELPPGDDPDPYGLPRLRQALAGHLRRVRGIAVGPENIMVTRGTGNGLDLVAAAFLRPGGRAGVEDPGYDKAGNIFAARGAGIVPCPVDDDGVLVDGLPEDLGVLYTTPAHQYPLGGRLPVPRRERLLAWARRSGALVVEDDYDAEFRYDVAPLPALYGLDPARVILLGTMSKSLSPDVGVGWLVAVPELLDTVARTRRALSDRTGGPAQQAVAVLLERGDLDRHLRRMRLEYARRRAAIVAALGPRVTGGTAGLHVMVGLPEHEVGPLVEAARARGVLLETTARYHRGPVRRPGIVLGYGSASLSQVRRAVAVLAELLEPVRPSARPGDGPGRVRACGVTGLRGDGPTG
nr:PLP-dependent aminotransferase family protein [Planomonospora venezuelensis]